MVLLGAILGLAALPARAGVDFAADFARVAAQLPRPTRPAAAAADEKRLERITAVASRVMSTMLTGMSPERMAWVEKGVKVYPASPETSVADAAAGALETLLTPADARTMAAEIRAEYRTVLEENARNPEPSRVGGVRGYSRLLRTKTGEMITICIVGEENLAAAGEWDENGNRARRVLVHEYAHAVYHSGMTAGEHARLREIGRALMAAQGQTYKDGDEDELFAFATEVWFGRHQMGPYKAGWSATDRFENFAGMMKFVASIFGPARDA